MIYLKQIKNDCKKHFQTAARQTKMIAKVVSEEMQDNPK